MLLEARAKTPSNAGNMSATKTLGNESLFSSGKNQTFFGKLRKVGAGVSIGAIGLTGIGMLAPHEKNIDQEALNSFRQRTPVEKVLSETGNAFAIQKAKAATEGAIGEPAFKAASFSDGSESNPYYGAITGMADARIIGGFEDGTFGPDKPVTRQQFAKMIDGTMNLTVVEGAWNDKKPPFNDVVEPNDPNSLYPNDYIAVAFQNGITQGKTPGNYAPYDNITRAQVDTMIVRAAQNLKPGVLRNPPGGYVSSEGNFDPTHGPNLTIAEYNGLTDGLVGYGRGLNWNPWQNSTRAECAQMLWNLKNKIENSSNGVKGLEGSLITVTLQELLQNKEPKAFKTAEVKDSPERQRLNTLYAQYNQGETALVVEDTNNGDEMNAVVVSGPLKMSNDPNIAYSLDGYGMNYSGGQPEYGDYIYKGATLEGSDNQSEFVMVFENPDTGEIFPMQVNLDPNDGNDTGIGIVNLKQPVQDANEFRGIKYRLFYQLENGLEVINFIKPGDRALVFVGKDFNGNPTKNNNGIYKMRSIMTFRFDGYDQLKQALER